MVLTMLIRGSIQISNVGGQSVGPVQTSPSQLGQTKLLYPKKHKPNKSSHDTRSWAHTYVCRLCLEYPARLRHGRRRLNKEYTHVVHVTLSNYKTNGADWSQWPPTVILTCSTFNSILFSQSITWLRYSHLTTSKRKKKKSDSW